jgi:hypothetical protein
MVTCLAQCAAWKGFTPVANEQNLIKGGAAHKLTVEEASKGGKASGKARRKKREIREMLEEYLAMPAKVNGKDATRKDVMVLNAIRIVTEGNASDSDFLKAFALIRDTIGEQPVQRVEVDTIDPQARERVERILSED